MKTICALILLVASASAGTPIDFNKWHISDSTYQVRMGVGDPRNYEKPDRSWAKINNNFKAEGDSVLYVDESVLQARVNKNGESSVTLNWGGQDYIVTQKLLGVGLYSRDSTKWIRRKATNNWSNVSVDSNIISWAGVTPGIDYEVIKTNGRVEHRIFFSPVFLDSVVAIADSRGDALFLANAMVYTFSSNVDNADSAMGELSWRQLKALRDSDSLQYKFMLTDQRLRYDTEGDLDSNAVSPIRPIPVKQVWRKRNDSIFCFEVVRMSDVKAVHEANPTLTVWHNDTKVIEGTTNVEDASLVQSGADNNYGGFADMLHRFGSTDWYPIIRPLNIASEIGAGATVTAAVCSLYLNTYSSGGTATALRCVKPWVEGDESGVDDDDGDVTYNDWASDANEWTTEGALCVGDGVDNSQDNSACNASRRDKWSTEEDNFTITGTGWYELNMTDSLYLNWYDGDWNENGIIIVGTVDTDQRFSSTEKGSNEPFWVFTFTVADAGEETEGIIHDIDGLKNVHDIDGVKKVHAP